MSKARWRIEYRPFGDDPPSKYIHGGSSKCSVVAGARGEAEAFAMGVVTSHLVTAMQGLAFEIHEIPAARAKWVAVALDGNGRFYQVASYKSEVHAKGLAELAAMTTWGGAPPAMQLQVICVKTTEKIA